jgi:hypothetical protein
MNAV